VETVAFYSYKGGVGRSLLLANAAQFLATLGKRVVALDFDFEAPGLHYKFSGVPRQDISGGAVPYLLATATGAEAPPTLKAHSISLAVPSGGEGDLQLIPAGPAPSEQYWADLKQLGERLLLNDPGGSGFMAVLDLQARIRDEMRPDYLLIDARAGVTELGGLTTTILADTVVCLFAPNHESLDGTLKIVEALKAAPRLDRQKPVRVVPVLSRATSGAPDDKAFTTGVQRLLELSGRSRGKGKKASTGLLALPHDETFGEQERLVGRERNANVFSPLYKAYLELFQDLFP
jgi:cellulose biosynthesis protein BcsQ